MTIKNSSEKRKRGPGRPQRRDETGAETEERLLDAAVLACVENGFEGTTMSDIARRVGIKVPSIYNYYPTKAELLIAAVRRSIDEIFVPLLDNPQSPAEAIKMLFSPALKDTRRLAIELHSAGSRHADIAELMNKWHQDSIRLLRPLVTGPAADARIKSVFILIMGICHVDEFESLPGGEKVVRQQIADLAESILNG